jgi:GNAT superfamily N-acetyltransferase
MKVYGPGRFQSIVNLSMTRQQAESMVVRLEDLSNESSNEALLVARELLLEYGRFVIAQPGAARFCFGSLEREAARLPVSYGEQAGGCLLAFAANVPTGFVAWRAIAPSSEVIADAWEMKRLWVRPTGRGLGLGKALTEAVLNRAVAAKRKAVYLDTAPASMGAAYRMYLDMGFTPCAPYNDNPVEGLAYLVKLL